jgi:hypothetical protein
MMCVQAKVQRRIVFEGRRREWWAWKKCQNKSLSFSRSSRKSWYAILVAPRRDENPNQSIYRNNFTCTFSPVYSFSFHLQLLEPLASSWNNVAHPVYETSGLLDAAWLIRFFLLKCRDWCGEPSLGRNVTFVRVALFYKSRPSPKQHRVHTAVEFAALVGNQTVYYCQCSTIGLLTCFCLSLLTTCSDSLHGQHKMSVVLRWSQTLTFYCKRISYAEYAQ